MGDSDEIPKWQELSGCGKMDVICSPTVTATPTAVLFNGEDCRPQRGSNICRVIRNLDLTCDAKDCFVSTRGDVPIECPWDGSERTGVVFRSSCDTSTSPSYGIIIGVPVAAVVILVIVITLIITLRKRSVTSKRPENGAPPVNPVNCDPNPVPPLPPVQRQDSGLYMTIPDNALPGSTSTPGSPTELWNGTPNISYGTLLVDNSGYKTAEDIHRPEMNPDQPPRSTPPRPPDHDPEERIMIDNPDYALPDPDMRDPSNPGTGERRMDHVTESNGSGSVPVVIPDPDSTRAVVNSQISEANNAPEERNSDTSMNFANQERDTPRSDDNSSETFAKGIIIDDTPLAKENTYLRLPETDNNQTDRQQIKSDVNNTHPPPDRPPEVGSSPKHAFNRNPGYVHVLEIPRLPNRFNDGK